MALNATKMTKFAKKKIDKKNIKCFSCNQKGHFKSACPKIKREDAKNGTQVNGDKDSYVALHSDTVTGQSATWIIDSGASNHLTWDIGMFKNYSTLEVPRKVVTASAASLTILGEGDAKLNIWNGNKWQPIVLKKCLHVKGL